MTARRGKGKLSPEVREAYVVLIEGVLRELMEGLLKSEDIEERYVALRNRVRQATEEQVAVLARTAAEYFVTHTKGKSPSRHEVDLLKKAALDHALKTLD